MTSDGTYNYTYDADGNMITKTAVATGVEDLYTYDYRNRLTEVQQVSGGVTTTLAQYTYDALNNQIEVVEGGATRYTLYDGQTPLLDFNGSGTVTARYLSIPGAIDELLARQTSAGVAWYLTDREGSVNDIINNSGTVIDHVDYSAYGTVLDESSLSNGDRFKYAGMEYDAVISLYYDRARYYDPAGGRFVAQDPMAFGAGDSNVYRYVGNDVLNALDTNGYFQSPAAPGQQPQQSLATQIREATDEANFLETSIKWDQDKLADINKQLAQLQEEINQLTQGRANMTLAAGLVTTCIGIGGQVVSIVTKNPVKAPTWGTVGVAGCAAGYGYYKALNMSSEIFALQERINRLHQISLTIATRIATQQAALNQVKQRLVKQRLAALGISYPVTYPITIPMGPSPR
jgi:RHS repeat-associated protein